MKKIKYILLLIPCLLLLSAQTTKATHSIGANISYVHDTLNTYTVTVKFYRNCGDSTTSTPSQAPPTFTVRYASVYCGFSGTITIPQISNTGQEIPTGQYPPCSATFCNGGTGYGVQEYIYKGVITLPSACPDWIISTSTCCRNQIITTLTGPGTLDMYVEAKLDNLNYPNNSSPVFSTYPVSRFCINHTFHYNQVATDPDGDTLVYSLVDAYTLGVGPVSVPYITTPILYSGTNPVASNPPVTIDSATGIITLTPYIVQVGVIAILVQEYRNGVLIGSVRRDMQVNIEANCNFPPLLHLAVLNNNNGNIVANCGDTVLFIHLNAPVKCNSVAPDGSDFRMLAPGGQAIPVTAEIPINCGADSMTDSIEIHLYQLSGGLSENGTYYIWSKVGNDGNTLLNDCGNAMAEYDTATFNFDNCYHGIVDLTNVTVTDPNSAMEVQWSAPSNIPAGQFQSFDIERSDTPTGTYSGLTTVTSSSVSSYIDNTVNVPVKPYSYHIKIHLNTGYVSPSSDSIQSIFLTGVRSADSTNIALSWTPYWGWSNPTYQVMQSDDYGATFNAVSGAITNNTAYTYVMPDLPGTFLVRVQTTSSNLTSHSNWYTFDVIKSVVVPANVMTPNGDGFNDTFIFENLKFYPNSKLTVFNRWGKKVYESSNYQNDWKGDNMTDGVYYYTMKVGDKKASVFTGTVTILRNK